MTDVRKKSRKQVSKPAKEVAGKAPFPMGPDKKTANERLRDLLGSRDQSWLARACSALLGPRADGEPPVKPQNIERFINDRDDFGRSSLIPAVAEVFAVRAFWLQNGIGPMADEEVQVVRQIVERFRPAVPPKQ